MGGPTRAVVLGPGSRPDGLPPGAPAGRPRAKDRAVPGPAPEVARGAAFLRWRHADHEAQRDGPAHGGRAS
ncbi:hypothetical protein GCM10010510_53550 [Streptomyces anandii JCM 4720]|nr:hypothetical protein GCM10010510_53550 [Streptomyces anandii JCM 4720]